MNCQSAGWTAGAAVVPFAVAVGTPLAGYLARTDPATDTLDELSIGALFFQREGERLAIVAADIVAVDATLARDVAGAAGLPRSQLVLCASHTHSGPAGVVARLHPTEPCRVNPDLRARFVAACARAIGTSRRRTEPVAVLLGHTETSGVAANRNNPDGPYDSRLSVLATRRGNGTLQGMLVHFACHPTILGAGNLLVSADFPGAMRRALGAGLVENGAGPVVLFANGAAGDVSTRFLRRGQDPTEVKRVGAALGAAAIDGLTRAREVDGPIRHGSTGVPLHARSLDEIAVALATARARLRGDLLVARSGGERRRAETQAQGASLLAGLPGMDGEAGASALELDAWSVGDVTLVAVAGELFASLGKEVAAAMPSPTLILGYANGYVGYLADEAAYASGTYEALASPYAAGTGELVAKAAATLVMELASGGGAAVVQGKEYPGGART